MRKLSHVLFDLALPLPQIYLQGTPSQTCNGQLQNILLREKCKVRNCIYKYNMLKQRNGKKENVCVYLCVYLFLGKGTESTNNNKMAAYLERMVTWEGTGVLVNPSLH